MAEDGRVFDSVYFSAKAAEIQFKRLVLLNKAPVGEIEFNGMKIEFLADGKIKVSGWGGVEVADAVLIAPRA